MPANLPPRMTLLHDGAERFMTRQSHHNPILEQLQLSLAVQTYLPHRSTSPPLRAADNHRRHTELGYSTPQVP